MLKNFYLAGPIMDAKDPFSWRREYALKLQQVGYGSIDPLSGHRNKMGVLRKLTEQSCWAELQCEYQQIVDDDIWHLIRCDAVILKYDFNCISVGSMCEAFAAWSLGIPVFLITKAKPKKIARYSWLNAFITKVFRNIDELFDYLEGERCNTK